MPAFLIGLALKAGIPARFAKVAVIVALIVLAVGTFFGAKALYDRSVIRDHTQKQEGRQTKRERTADTNLELRKDVDEAAARLRQQEIDNATKNIPDQAPSARQRARACVELVRQAKAAGQPIPACEPAPTR